MNTTQCPTCQTPMVYRNGAVPEIGTPPMNPSNSGRDRSLVCGALYRTGAHAAEYYGDAGMCDEEGCTLRADWQAEISGPRYCGYHVPTHAADTNDDACEEEIR